MSTEKTITLKAHHVGISVPDLDASVKWYKEILGFELKFQLDLAHIGAKIAFIRHGDFELELFEVAGAAPLPEERLMPDTDLLTHGTKHVCFIVEDLEETAAILKEKDVFFAKELTQMPDGKVIFIRDNAGVLIEIIEKFPVK